MCRMAVMIGDQGALERAKGGMIDSLIKAAKKIPMARLYLEATG